jgi:hypothetical protein
MQGARACSRREAGRAARRTCGSSARSHASRSRLNSSISACASRAACFIFTFRSVATAAPHAEQASGTRRGGTPERHGSSRGARHQLPHAATQCRTADAPSRAARTTSAASVSACFSSVMSSVFPRPAWSQGHAPPHHTQAPLPSICAGVARQRAGPVLSHCRPPIASPHVSARPINAALQHRTPAGRTTPQAVAAPSLRLARF